MSNAIRFSSPADDKFTQTLKQRVNAYFSNRGLSEHGNALMWAKVIFYLGWYLGSCALILSGRFTGVTLILLYVSAGFATAGIGFNIAHDACHSALSSREWVNRLFGHTFTLIGAHAYNWKITHNVIHHSFTNIPYADGDLHPGPWLRFCQLQEGNRWYHRFQHLYAIPLYCLTTVSWVFLKDYLHMTRKVHTGYNKPNPPAVEYFFLIAAKLLHYAAFLAIPIGVLHLPLWQVITGFFLLHAAAGSSLAIVFAVGHVVEQAEFPKLGEDRVIKNSWFAHQVRTTCNFATKNPFFFWTVGGLNFQIEHHLFPRVCHIHYPAIQPIVRETVREFGLPYNEFETLSGALREHLHYLRDQGALAAQPA
ncbi:MAG: acyl-CoA desaturase [Bdellovibrionota bacterium]